MLIARLGATHRLRRFIGFKSRKRGSFSSWETEQAAWLKLRLSRGIEANIAQQLTMFNWGQIIKAGGGNPRHE